jgi:hypothetical protein
MKSTLISQELDKDLRERERMTQKSKNINSFENESDSEEDTIYETMLDIQLRRDDSKTFFDNEIEGEVNKKSRRNPSMKIHMRNM